jgi:hypothetical protein
MNKTLTIKYWWKCPTIKGELPMPLQAALDESAKERIFAMLQEDYVSGELLDSVNLDLPGLKTPVDGFECHGWFDVTETAD